ncbi:hypothetical protein SteCoe_41 [Stentor coeruleus]|uniref:phosphoglycerate mutase (2,3-diphosphoglycerate-dependent) n=1 Tax=Stentor coeruleus TaxID=5963 RepID=A0A1R2D528_9CILI|nr:hypothetical protein SteCoe_41 [Stentor coeruleus]
MSRHATMILLCAGECMWDDERKIAGWTDVPLSELGVNQCKEAAEYMRRIKIDVAFTSVLKRGIHTTCIVLDELDLNCVKIKKHWRLNPRHYGIMQGVLRSEAKKHENYQEVRRGLTQKFPSISTSDETHPSHDFRYSLVPCNSLPGSESLEDTKNRVIPYWYDKIAPCLLKGKNILVVTHKNTVRALRHFLNDYEGEIENLEVASGVPRVYEFNEKLEIIDKKNLGDHDEISQRISRLIV